MNRRGPDLSRGDTPHHWDHPPRCATVTQQAPTRVVGRVVPRGNNLARAGSALHSGARAGADADRAAHARAAEPTVPTRVLAQVLLVVVLGVIERGRREDLGGDRVVTRGAEPLLVHLARRGRRLRLRLIERVDAGAVLRAGVVAL